MDELLARCAHAGLPIAPASDAAVHAGAASLRRNASQDPVTAREVTLAGRTAGAADDLRQLSLPRLTRWRRPHRGADPWRTPLPPWGMRLSRLLRDLRRTLGDRDLTVQWADDGHTCRLVSVTAG